VQVKQSLTKPNVHTHAGQDDTAREQVAVNHVRVTKTPTWRTAHNLRVAGPEDECSQSVDVVELSISGKPVALVTAKF
jgi:hypothetical protein